MTTRRRLHALPEVNDEHVASLDTSGLRGGLGVGPFAVDGAGLPAQAQPRAGGELIFAVPSEPPSYDGHREETFGLIHPIAPFYSLLLRVDPDRL